MDTNEQSREVTTADLDRWLARVDAMREAEHERQGFTFERDRIGYTVGRKYARVITIRPTGGQSAFCFVRMADGVILKADGWKRPAKGPRGSIFSAQLSGVTQYGAVTR